MTSPGREAPFVLVRLYAGLGNNIFQIATGHALARRLSARTGVDHPCWIVLPDPVDTTKSFSAFEVLGGHLRADNHYAQRHRDAGLPSPFDLAAVFPSLNWMTFDREAEPRRLLRRKLADALSQGRDEPHPRPDLRTGHRGGWDRIEDYLDNPRYLDVCVDARYRAAIDPNIGHVLNCYFSPTTIPFHHSYWHPEARTLSDLFSPSDAVTRYIRSTYGLGQREHLIGIHLRNDQRVADIHRSDAVSIAWHVDCVKDILKTGRAPKVLIVSNHVAHNDASLEIGTVLKREIRRCSPEIEIVESTEEPYYIDFFLLRLCTHLVISCSTFSFGAGMTAKRLKKMYVPNSFSARHFCNHEFPEYCAFIPDREGPSGPP